MNLINQQEDWDCGIAATAMFLDKSYDETRKEYFPHSTTALSVDEIVNTLYKSYSNICRISYCKLTTEKLPEANSILLVPSKNNSGAHYVFWDGSGMIDPQTNIDGKNFYSYTEEAPVFWCIREL